MDSRATQVDDERAGILARVSRACVVRISSGPTFGEEVALASRPVLIGAGPDCSVVLDDAKVSRRHCELRLVEEGVEVRDCDSRNGTFVDGVRVSTAIAAIGATLKVGDTTLQLTNAEPLGIDPSTRDRFGGLIGRSAVMREIFAVLELVAPSEATVLLIGESGTGKELAARAVHDHSRRPGGPFVVFDCSSVKPELIESQLFGHVRGAFTGAAQARDGAFVRATGGTLFIDELGELPLDLQGRLLRALESRTVQALGSDSETSVDVRIVAATHRDLSAMVAQRTFRFDLYQRISVVQLQLPPLKARLDDIAPLVEHFYEGRKVSPGPIDGAGLAALQGRVWPGNVRELRNVLERAFVLSGETAPAFATLTPWLGRSNASSATQAPRPAELAGAFKEAKARSVEAFERSYLDALMRRFDGNISHAATFAELSRHHVRELLVKHGLYDGDGDGSDR